MLCVVYLLSNIMLCSRCADRSCKVVSNSGEFFVSLDNAVFYLARLF